jgi:hypothetical protein
MRYWISSKFGIAGIGGIIKALWSDFVVEEVRLEDASLVCLEEGIMALSY